MSKKKRRYTIKKKHKKRKIIPRFECMAKDTHHILWVKTDYNRGALDDLRTFWYCKILIPKCTLHRLIHHEMRGIPAPPMAIAQSALDQLRYLDNFGVLHDNDSLEKRLRLLISLFECAAQPTADALKEQLKIVRNYYNQPP